MSNFPRTNCDECETSTADIRCTLCDQQLCTSCDLKVHNKGKRIEHQRIKIDQNSENTSSSQQMMKQSNQINSQESSKIETPITSDSAELSPLYQPNAATKKQKKIQLNLKSPDYQISSSSQIAQQSQQQQVSCSSSEQASSATQQQYPVAMMNNLQISSGLGGLPPGLPLTTHAQGSTLQQQQQGSCCISQQQQQQLLLQQQQQQQDEGLCDYPNNNNSNEQYPQQQAFQEIFDEGDAVLYQQQQPSLLHQQQQQQQQNQPQDLKIMEIALFQPIVSMDPVFQAIEVTLREFAEKGDLMVLYPTFRAALAPRIPPGVLDLDMAIQSATLISHMTIRKFGDSEPMFFVSLRLQSISLQSMIWIIQSIKKDLMTPTEKLIFSRIKECYGIKMTQYVWNCVMLYLQQLSDCHGVIDLTLMQQQQQQPKLQGLQQQQPALLPNLKLTKTMDPLNNNEFFIIRLWQARQPASTSNSQSSSSQQATSTESNNALHWVAQDQGPLLPSDLDNWVTFVEYLKDFFRDDSKQMWISSVMNIHSNDPKKSQVKPPKSVNKAIPGGRYGCAQLLKCCGPAALRGLSLGKLSFYVQEAITKGLLIYYKTLLIKGTVLDDANSQKLFVYEQEKLMKIKLVKDVIVEILKENRKGVSLARLPKLIQRRVNFVFDIQDLGFLKLKNMLKTIDGVFIENDGTTFACAYLQDGFLGFNFEQVLHDIREHIKLLSFQNPCGVQSQAMYYQLCVKINQRFNYQAFNQKTFDDFLHYYCEDVIELKRHQGSVMVLPKRKCSIQILGDRRQSGLRFGSSQFDQQLNGLNGGDNGMESAKRNSIQLSWSNSSISMIPSLATTKNTDNEDMQKSLQFIEELLVESDDMQRSSKGNSQIWDNCQTTAMQNQQQQMQQQQIYYDQQQQQQQQLERYNMHEQQMQQLQQQQKYQVYQVHPQIQCVKTQNQFDSRLLDAKIEEREESVDSCQSL